MCDGTVRKLSGQRVLFTGKVFLDGEWRFRTYLTALVKGRGVSVLPNPTKQLTLLVEGELIDNVVDPVRGWSDSLRYAVTTTRAGRHIHIVSSSGFSSLIHGGPAPCLTTRFAA